MIPYQVKKLGPCWWIVGDAEYGPIGPYDNKADAESDKRGLRRFEKHQNEDGYVSVDSNPRECER